MTSARKEAPNRLEISMPNDLEAVFTRSFDAPRDLVWKCHTTPELVRRWLLGPSGWTMPVCEIDLRVGGRYRYVWRNADGRDMGMGGVFREVVAPERLVATELFDEDWTGGETVTTQVFSERAGKTTLTLTVRYSSKEARDAALNTGMTDGMEAGYGRLDELFAGARLLRADSGKTPKISPFLWFDKEAEEAANHYVSIFKNAKVRSVVRSGDAGPGPKGGVMVVDFEIDGQKFTALNGGPHFKFNESVSFVVDCKDQAEVDYYWERLVEGGAPGQCGWLKDKFGLSWQIVPRRLTELMSDPDAGKARRATEAMLKMSKIDVGEVERAAAG
jgi:predicted 3-demethylubiquinone-9 3-methyltransferase (glyoxalase superfamily)/uncharacterized protein YndB with AHSA1/START domain